MSKRKPPTFEQELRTFVKKHLRRASLQWRFRTIAKNKARRERGRYECAMCKGLFKDKEYQLDHILPVVDIKDPEYTIEQWVRNLLPDETNFQVICINCHLCKSSVEEKLREIYKKKKKSNKKTIDKNRAK